MYHRVLYKIVVTVLGVNSFGPGDVRVHAKIIHSVHVHAFI